MQLEHTLAGATQAPPLHCPDEHERPHDPQLFGSVDVSTQKPEHSRSPLEHVAMHDPNEQYVPLRHVEPQLPQFDELEFRSTHDPLQYVVPPVHVETQEPDEQDDPLTHANPQVPQFAESESRLTHVPPQSVSPAPHVGPQPVHAPKSEPDALQRALPVRPFAHTQDRSNPG